MMWTDVRAQPVAIQWVVVDDKAPVAAAAGEGLMRRTTGELLRGSGCEGIHDPVTGRARE
jgi:hypothetical protein